MKKRVYLKKWLERVLSAIACITFMLIAITIDSEWTKEYLLFLLINMTLFVSSSYLLINYSKEIVEENKRLGL